MSDSGRIVNDTYCNPLVFSWDRQCNITWFKETKKINDKYRTLKVSGEKKDNVNFWA